MRLDAWMAAFGDPSLVFRDAAILLGVGQIIISLEYLWLHREFDRGGMFAWPILRLARPARPWPLMQWRDLAFGKRGVVVLLLLRILVASALLVSGANEVVSLLAIVALFGLLLVFNVRIPWGREGADDVSLHAALGLSTFALCRWLGAPSLGLYYVAAYGGLAYVTAGVTKLIEPKWRSGEALAWVLNLQAFGAPWALELLAVRPRLQLVLSWAVMLAEVGAPLAVFLPAPAMAVALAAGIAFHVALALCLGVNTFVWAFSCTYPCALLVWTKMPHVPLP